MSIVDLRSDTVTRPSAAMRRAMAEAEVGDDVYGEDPTIIALEEAVAAAFGHAAALFVPSGTMGNQIALRLTCQPGEEVVCDADAHVVSYESGGAAQHGGLQTRTLVAERGLLDPAAVAAQIRLPGYHVVPTRTIAVEQTHNRGGGAVYPLSRLDAIRRLAADASISLHCDGARIWNAHVAAAVPLAEYGSRFDTMSVCFSKGLGAPVGSAVTMRDASLLTQARELRHRLGGAMRQAGILAAGAAYALQHNVSRLAEDHVRAHRLATGLADVELGLVDPATVETNIVPLDLSASGLSAATLSAACRAEGVLVSPVGPQRVRLVTHLDVDDADVDRALDVLRRTLTAG